MEARDEFDCALCMKLLVEPVGLLCGHTFCKSCIKRSLALQPSCPMCRASCHLSIKDVVPNLLLCKVIESRFGDELRERIPEVAQDEAELDAQRLGLFFLKSTGGQMFPHAPIGLMVYEPRYLLLMQRCMNNSIAFGVQEDARSPGGVAVKIESVQQLAGGRLLVAGSAVSRYKLGAPPEEEQGTYGLHYAPVQFLTDEPLSSQPGPLSVSVDSPSFFGLSDRSKTLLRACAHDANAATLLRNAMASTTVRLISSLSASAFRAINARYGTPPPASGIGSSPERWSYYLSDILGLPAEAKARAFDTRSTLERLLLCYSFLEGAERDAVSASNVSAATALPQLPPGELDPCAHVLAVEVLEPYVRPSGLAGAALRGGPLGRVAAILQHPIVSSLLVLVALVAGIYWGSKQQQWHHV